MKKLLLFTVLVLVAAASAAYSLTLLDKIVHGTLYNYGLQFSYDWASPYWTMLRVVQGLMVLTAVFSVVSFVYVYRKYIHTRPLKPQAPQVIQAKGEKGEKKVVPSPLPPLRELEPPSETQRMGGLVKCTHCNRVFAQPLRMLDFHSDRPRIINICPFCNELIPPILRNEEAEKGKKIFFKGKKNDQAQRKEEAKEAEEKVAA